MYKLSWHIYYLLFDAFCPVVNCGDPGTPRNGQLTGSSTTYNSAVTYTCNTGYTRQGSNRRTCQSNGQWSGSLPRCNRESAFSACVKHIYYMFKCHSTSPCEYNSWNAWMNCCNQAVTQNCVSYFNFISMIRLSWLCSSDCCSYFWIILFHVFYLQRSTVVILVLPPMVDALAPVQPTTLQWPTPVTQDTQDKDLTGEPASPMDSGAGVYLDATVSSLYL